MMWISTLILVAGLAQPAIQEENPEPPMLSPLQGSPAEICLEGLEQGRFEEAAPSCLEAVENDPGNTRLIRKAAALLFEADEGLESARCWKMILDQEGWSCETALKRANALWRGGRMKEAQTAFAESREKCTNSSSAAYEELGFLESFGLWKEAALRSRDAEKAFPDDCRISELRAVAEDQLGAFDAASEAVSRALAKGCPAFRWAKLGTISHHLDRPEYAPFLTPEKITTGLEKLDDSECAKRLLMLKGHMTPEVIKPVLEVLLGRKKTKTRLIALGLISELGNRAGDIWKTLLASDDFILRKYTLREIRKLRDPAFIPLLQDHLGKEKSKGNIDLTRMALGELFYNRDEKEKAVGMLESISRDGYLFQPAQLLLAKWARKAGEDDQELGYLEEAQAADPSTFLEVERLEELREKLAAEAEAAKLEKK